MTMSAGNEKRMLDRETLRSVIQQWNTVRLDIFALSEPNENLEFHGVMRFYFQDEGQKVATKCIRVASDATVSDVIETLIEKFRPDMRMLSLPNYALYVVHANGEERKLNPDEKPLLVQLNWHNDDREGRFLLKNCAQKTNTLDSITDQPSFKRKLSKREKKEQKKKEKLSKLGSGGGNENHVAEKLYTELPETSFTRSISNPEAVMRRRRQQKLEKKLQQFRSRDGGPDTGGTLKIYGESLCRDVPYKTLLLSIRDCAQAVVREMLAKYGMDKVDPLHYCLVQVNSDGSEYILDDDECPLSILMNHPTSRGSIMFHVRRRPADSQPRRRKKKPLGVSNGSGNLGSDREGPMLIEITHSGDGGRRVKLGIEPIEVGSANTNALQLFGPSIQARHCLISMHDGVCTVTPLHADGTTFVNGHHIQQPTILHNGSVVMFGRVASYRFVDSPSDGRYNLALSQSQLDSACLYESRSPTSPTSWNEEESRPISPVSSVQPAPSQKLASGGSFLESTDGGKLQLDQQQITKPPSFDIQTNPAQPPTTTTTTAMGNPGGPPALPPHNIHQTQNLLMTSLDVVDMAATAGGVALNDDAKSQVASTEFSNDGDVGNIETETKSISSLKSIGSTQDRTSTFPKLQPSHAAASISSEPGGQEPILPAVLEFPEQHQESFLQAVISELDVNSPNFKLAPVYTLYLCARYRASTHYRPDLQPTERAHKLTVFLHHVANLIQNVVQEQYTDAKILSFWMANSSEFLHFLKSDRHISAFSVQAQEVLAESVQTAFRNLVSIFHVELSQTLNQFLSENIDHDSAAGLVLSVLGSAMALLRRCRVNAALTIQLFSQLFHYINVVCFNKFVTTSHMCTSAWGRALTERLSLLELWAEKQGLELAADCHLAKINQCAQFLQAPKTSVTEVQQLACSCFRLNSLQMGALLSQETIPRNLIDTAVRMAESVADELSRADGREIRLEESPELPLALLLPDDGFSCDVVRGIPAGLVDFLSPFQMANMCRLASQPTSIGLWTVYMHQFNQGRSPSVMSSKLPQPEIQLIKLHKNANGMGLSIVAAKGAGQERLGIYIKSVVTGGAADLDGRLQAGDQLLEVDGQSLIGITQERAADHLVRTGPVVTLKVAKQGAIYHGLATLLQQPSPVIQREIENEFNCNVYDNDGNQRYHFGRSNESLNFHGSSRSMSRRGSLRQPLTPVMTHTTSTPYLSYHDAYRRMSNPDISQGRRFSVSLSQDDILSNDQLQQIHFDPRYRDCRSTVSLNSSLYNRSRSNSLGSIGRGLAAACSTGIPTMPCIQPPILNPTRYDTPPSIYVEDYDSRGSSHNSSREMIKIEESVEPEPESPVAAAVAHVPVFELRIEAPSTESNLSFVADVNLDDIPFIDDDDDEERETRFYTTRGSAEDLRPAAPPPPVPPPYVAAPPPPPPPAPTPVVNSATLGNIASIMINPGSRRGSNSSCRKTVSFDIITDSSNSNSQQQQEQDINGGTTTVYEDDNYSSHYHHHYHHDAANNGHQHQRDVNGDGEEGDDEGVLGDEDEDEELSSFRSRLARGTKKSPSEPIFKFCKVKPSASSSNSNISYSNKNINNNNHSNSSATRGYNNNNDSNNGSEEEEDEDEESEEDIDDAVRQSHVEAIREYVCSNFVTSSSPQDWPRTRARRRMSQSNNNYNINSVANGGGGDDADGDHCKLLRNIRLLKESSGTNHHSVNSHSNSRPLKGGRRMSERDMTRIGTSNDPTKPPVPSTSGQQLLNSKSVPALHHVGGGGGGGTVGTIGSSVNKSRSIHNLAGGNVQDQGFYQNLSVYRAQNQSHPNLGERPQMPLQTSLNSPGASISSGSSSQHQQQQQQQQQPILSRPASAYFNSNNSTNPNTLLLTTPTNSMSAYGMPNQQQQQQQQQPPLSSNISHPNLAGAAGGTMNNRLQQKMHQQQFVRDAQGQQSLRLNQMMAPSMPNIAHPFQQQQQLNQQQQGHQHPAQQHLGGISASQSMQNVNMIAGGGGGFGFQNGSPMMSPQLYPNEQQQHASLLRGQAKLAEMNELLKRRNQIVPPQQQQQQQRSQNSQDSSMMPSPQMPQHQQAQQHPGFSGASPHPGGTPLSSHKQMLPPTTAPKPLQQQQQLRPDQGVEHPPLPPTATHPLYKTGPGSNSALNAPYSSSEAPKVGFYPSQVPTMQNKNMTGTNPWEREEKEKETELRREQIRAWRDQQIAELQSMPHRTPQQEDQLRTLALERDFERRAMEEDQDFDNDTSPYGKDPASVQEVLRLTQASNTITAPQTKMKQVDIKMPSVQNVETASNDSQASNSVANTIASFQQQVASASASIQPKSILKHNNSSTPSSPSKSAAVKSASFAAQHDKNLNLSEITMNNTNANQMMSQMALDMAQLNLAADRVDEDLNDLQAAVNGYGQQDPNNQINNNGIVPPPPPPERNSSYVIMSQQQQKLRSSATKLTFNNTVSTEAQQQQQQQNLINNNPNNNSNNNTLGRYNSNNLLTTAQSPMTPQQNNANANNNNANVMLMNNALLNSRRVSFHDEDSVLANMMNNNGGNNGGSAAGGSIGSSYTEAGHLIGSSRVGGEQGDGGDLGTIHERPDPDRFIDETMPAMLHTPTTPEAGESWNMQVQATPGVIGAQEVYRDPRTRRLAEQQQKQKAEPVPEKLSFKEKMKMFALESGENNTPKDKLKISRAQRDIDAVH